MLPRALRLLATLLFCIGTTAAPAATKTLKLTLPGEADKSIRQIASQFTQELASRSGGALAIDIGPQPQAYKDNEIVSAVSSGAIEIGGTTLNQFAYDVPLAGVFLQPFMFNFNALVRAAAKPGSDIRKVIDEEILYWTNTRVLWWQPNGANVILARTVPEYVGSLPRLGVGAPDDQSKELTRVCGGEAYLMPSADLHSALKAGTISLAMTDILGVKTYSLWQVSQAIINTQHAPSLYIFVINDRLWEGLTAQEQQTLTEVARDIQERTWDQFLNAEAEAYALARQHGMKIYDLMPQDVEAWRACSSPLLEAYMERVGEPGQKLFAAYGKLRTDPCCRLAPQETPTTQR